MLSFTDENISKLLSSRQRTFLDTLEEKCSQALHDREPIPGFQNACILLREEGFEILDRQGNVQGAGDGGDKKPKRKTTREIQIQTAAHAVIATAQMALRIVS